MPNSAEALVNQVSQVYSLPDVYTRLNAAMHDPYADLDQMAKIILDDAGVSTSILKLANSSLYAFPSRIDTITRAITIIGTKQLHDLVLATCVVKMFKNIPKNVLSMDAFWKHSIATGICARVIATYQRDPNVERFYLMGLLHDIGRLVMLIHTPELIKEGITASSQTNKSLLHIYEKENMGFDHTELAMYLLKTWDIPESIEKAVTFHHQPMMTTGFRYEASVIHFSDILVASLKFGSSGDRYIPPLNDEAWQLLNLKVSQIPVIVEQLERQYDDVVDIFLT